MTGQDLGRVERIGDTVHRPVGPWTPAVHGLLRHLEAVGYEHAPRVLGFDGQGREVLSWIGGESGPDGRAKVVDDRGLITFARLLRDYHDAVAGYRPADTTCWSISIAGPVGDEVVGHGDFGPWNTVWRGDRPVGVIDWDHARPAPRLHDVAYALEHTAPFGPASRGAWPIATWSTPTGGELNRRAPQPPEPGSSDLVEHLVAGSCSSYRWGCPAGSGAWSAAQPARMRSASSESLPGSAP